MEKVVFPDVSLEIPQGLCEDPSILLEIISPDTWNNVFSDKHREILMHFLPDFPEDDLEEKTRTLEMFFMHENFNFGNPLQNFCSDLSTGHFNPTMLKIRKIQKKVAYKSYKMRQKLYHHKLLEDVLVRRKFHLDRAKYQKFSNKKMNYKIEPVKDQDALARRVKRRYFKELSAVKAAAECNDDVSSDDVYPEGPGASLNKKQKRQLLLLDTSFEPNLTSVRGTYSQGSLACDLELSLISSKNPFEHSDDHFRSLLNTHLSKHKNKNDLTLDTRGITLQSIIDRSQTPFKKPFQKLMPSNLNAIGKHGVSHPSLTQKNKRLRSLDNRSKKSYPDVSSNSSSSDNEDIKPLPASLLNNNKRVSNKNSFKNSVWNKSIESFDSTKKGASMDIKEEVLDSNIKPPVNIKQEVSLDSLECQSEGSADLTNTANLAAELTQETHISYFSLLRDVICSTPTQRMNREQLEMSIRTWQESAISPLNEWFNICSSWVNVLSCAINFLCGVVTDSFSSDFVPYIEYKSNLKVYQWIGAGRDSDSNLEQLCNYWLSNRDNFSYEWSCGDINVKIEPEDNVSLPPPRFQTNWSVKPASEEEKITYHHQEKLRYDKPHKAFTFRTHGYESIIGPVKGIYSQQTGNTSKARGHSLLVNDRPPYVTILSLVRDAVARLPNGEGTKIDICELLKESQFILPTVGPKAENALNSVTSGALDRLQFGDDPCVKFDTSRKLWVYLHRNRTEKEFERIHHLNGPGGGGSSGKKQAGSSRKSKIKKEENMETTAPPNVTMEPFTPTIKQMDGSEVKVKAEDMLENWVSKRGQIIRPAFIQASPQNLKVKPKQSKITLNANTTTLQSPVTTQNSMLCVIKSTVPTQTDLKPKIQMEAIKTEAGDDGKIQRDHATSLPVLSDVVSLATTRPAATSIPLISKLNERKILEKKSGSSTTTAIVTPISSGVTKDDGAQRDNQMRGIKVLQYPNLQSIAAKGMVGNASLLVDSNTPLQTLVGQKLVVSGNRVLVQGGKVLQTASTSSIGGKPLLTSVLPAQQVMAVASTSADKSNQEAGRFIQIATLDGSGNDSTSSLKKLTFIPQFTPCRTINTQKPTETVTTTSATSVGMKTAIPLHDFKLKVSNTPATLVSSANVLNLGGKQIILTPKPNAASYNHPQIQQMVVAEPSSEGSGDDVKASAVGPQIVLPAAALQGSPINLKRLQTFQPFKVIPASPLQQKGKPLLAHIITTPVTQVTATSVSVTKGVSTNNIKPPHEDQPK